MKMVVDRLECLEVAGTAGGHKIFPTKSASRSTGESKAAYLMFAMTKEREHELGT